MMPDSVTLTLALMCLFAALLTYNHDRHLEPTEPTSTDDDNYDARRDEWAEDQAIERQWDTKH